MSANWLKLQDVSPHKLTPMMRQFLQAKAECGDSLLFFRMGDFYELFFEDALEAAELLGLTLTSRDSAEKDGRVPMAGVPVRAVDGYVARVIKAGRTVTICDQIEDPKDAKGIVQRAVVRTITPGTVLTPELLDERSNNYLAAVCLHGGCAGAAFVDVSTGEFLAAQITEDLPEALADELARMAPAEVLFSETDRGDFPGALGKRFDAIRFTPRPEHDFDPAAAAESLQSRFDLGTLKGVSLDDAPAAAGAAGAILAYVRETQRDGVPHLQLPRRYSPAGYVVLDASTQRNLELVESLADKSKRGTLLGVLDQTRTSMGGRRLRHWILHPLVDIPAIHARLNAVEALFERTETRLGLIEELKGIADLERLLGKITARQCNARDLKALGRSLDRSPALRAHIAGLDAGLLETVSAELDPLDDVRAWIAEAIVDEPPAGLQEGGLIADGHDPELDRLRGLVRGGRDWIAKLRQEESARTGIQNLKIGYNKVFGYYIEVSKAHAANVPDSYERKQTLVNAERYVTPALKSREEEIVTAQERMARLEYDLFTALRDRVAGQARRIQATAGAIATLDALTALAAVAANKNYAKPQVDDGAIIEIRDGRHPVVEDLMPRGDFVPNETRLDDGARLQIITGPNMAGKSTYLRQTALIVLMAQIGGFVPAAAARIGAVDRIFTRVGASDNLVRGESTFMVEMIETANILNAATARSLLVLDEIGRGTSTFDGISIAWSVAEYIHDRIQAKTLFATHYHELTELGGKLEAARNLNVAVRELGEKVIFLYRIVEGGADHSYGIQVARLAGLPPAVLGRARDILQSLEAGNTAVLGVPGQMQLFVGAGTGPSPVEEELEGIDPDALSPREAHETLYRLKHLLQRPRT